jgi:hypothetical protein
LSLDPVNWQQVEDLLSRGGRGKMGRKEGGAGKRRDEKRRGRREGRAAREKGREEGRPGEVQILWSSSPATGQPWAVRDGETEGNPE